VDTVIELAPRNAERLFAALKATKNRRALVHKLPAPSQVKSWVSRARKLPRALTH